MPASDDRSADQARAAIQAALGQIGFALPGSITICRTRCGKPRCACKADPPALHGPYIQWTRTVKGKTVNEARAMTRAFKSMMSIHESSLDGGDGELPAVDPDIKLGDLEALRGVVKFPVRIKCATLSWITLTQGLDEAEQS